MESQRAKRMIKKAIATYIMCVFISGIIYTVVVIENTYQNLLEAKADAYTVMFWILFLGFMILLLVAISPPFGKLLFRTFGAEESKGEQK